MNLDFLTPEIFNMLVMTNLVVALLLIAFRFYQDMNRKEGKARQLRELVHDESSHEHLSEPENSDINAVQQIDEKQEQQSQNQ